MSNESIPHISQKHIRLSLYTYIYIYLTIARVFASCIEAEHSARESNRYYSSLPRKTIYIYIHLYCGALPLGRIFYASPASFEFYIGIYTITTPYNSPPGYTFISLYALHPRRPTREEEE